MNSSVRTAIAAIPEGAWTAIRYPEAVWDDQLDWLAGPRRPGPQATRA